MEETQNVESTGGRSRRRFVLLGVVVLTIVAVTVCVIKAPRAAKWNRRIDIGPDTTVVSGPLHPDGTIDYLGAINDQCRRGVTPDNNAAVLLMQAIGLGRLEPWARPQLLSNLGVSKLPTEGGGFVSLAEYILAETDIVATQPAATPIGQRYEAEGVASRMLDQVMSVPWSADEQPVVNAWLNANEDPVELVVAASKRPEYFLPPLADSAPPMLIAAIAPLRDERRSAFRALIARAMRHLHAGDIEAAQSDLLAVHRLASLTGRSPDMIERLMAVGTDAEASEADQALVRSRSMSIAQATAYEAQLRSLNDMPDMTSVFDRWLRYQMLDIAMVRMRDVWTSAAGKSPDTSVDWNQVMRTINEWFDRVVAVEGIQDPAARRNARVAFDLEFERRIMQFARDEVWLDPTHQATIRLMVEF